MANDLKNTSGLKSNINTFEDSIMFFLQTLPFFRMGIIDSTTQFVKNLECNKGVNFPHQIQGDFAFTYIEFRRLFDYI
ncbi:hypothetical protein SUGI_0480630 [Cryptomeria japonica]|nr:hypothetical protein SUGI_0480630 [Cryptomeria japonica]